MSASHSAPSARERTWSIIGFDRIAICVLVVFPCALAMSWPRLLTVWQTGAFFDTDDAMRMVQVRDWLGGQGWFDLVAHRLDPAAGLRMHWSRVVDIPIGALVRLFGLMADPVHAERLARLAFPIGLQAAMIAATAWVGRILSGPQAMLPAAVLILLSGISYGQFEPGRIDHHAPQILLLMLATGTTMRALDPSQARWAATTGGLIALSMAISLENLPFFAILLTVPALSWAMAGERYQRTLVWFAGGLGIALPVLFIATVPPSRYTTTTCDALSFAHLTGLLAGVAGLAGLAAATSRLGDRRGRWAALCAVGILVLGLVLATNPACLHDPYAAMDPVLQRLWLRNVAEAQPLITAIRLHPDTFPTLVCPIVFGALATLVAVLTSRGQERAAWLVMAAVVGVGIGGAFWEVRVISSVSPLALLGGAWTIVRLLRLANRRPGFGPALLPFGALCLFSAAAWAFMPMPLTSDQSERQDSAGCRRPDAFDALALEPATLILAPIDSGSHILAMTPHSVLAAPYHRDQHGNRLMLDAFRATPEASKAIVEGSGAGLLTFCRDDTSMRLMAKDSPDGLAAQLMANRPPSWLEPVPASQGLYTMYRIR